MSDASKLPDFDGMTRAEIVRRLIELAEQEPRPIWSMPFWWQRLVALLRAWWV